MSYVTNVILSFSIMEEEKERMVEINDYLRKEYNQKFGNVDAKFGKSRNVCYGGSKYLETPLYVAAFNYVPYPEILDFLRTINWEYPECVQLIVKDQNDDKFTTHEL